MRRRRRQPRPGPAGSARTTSHAPGATADATLATPQPGPTEGSCQRRQRRRRWRHLPLLGSPIRLGCSSRCVVPVWRVKVSGAGPLLGDIGQGPDPEVLPEPRPHPDQPHGLEDDEEHDQELEGQVLHRAEVDRHVGVVRSIGRAWHPTWVRCGSPRRLFPARRFPRPSILVR